MAEKTALSGVPETMLQTVYARAKESRGRGGARRGNAMKDSELQFDRACHVLYSKPCKREIRGKIAVHYPEEEREAVWDRVQRQYVVFLADWRTDLGGSKNFHNGAGGTYDCIAILSCYTVCRAVTSFREIMG